ncbi:GntR family transcriptional regulator [Bowdeniella nasicola]|uniref:GntR family transcriptional regulator n=1 Tax=Bowdeniella nasicola TaxID=208480 RepID=A0A1Q5Q1S4_9ACTO|nr:GntR family transcriptional regulator [Bowdeniella nasicola]OKL53823.1 GntR family transcriptional regulator [Bowdeniella nasicola]
MSRPNRERLDEPFVPQVTLDRESDVPLYRQIAKPITDLILSGEVEPGRLIEDEVSLARRLDVSRPTARRALQDLVADGLLVRRRGAGTRVTPAHVHRKIGLTSLYGDLIKAGHTPNTEVLSYSVQLADEVIAEKLGRAVGDELVVIDRVRGANDSPLAIMHNVLPIEHAPTLSQLTRSGLYECLSQRGVEIASAIQVVGAKNADKREAELLDLEPGTALVTMERIAYDADGGVVEFGSHVYDAAQYRVTIPMFAD